MKPNFTSLFTLLFIAIISFNSSKAQAVDANDSLAIIDLYNSTKGSLWTNHTNWLTTAPVSTWYGVTVTCNKITGIALGVNNLTGTIPASIGKLTNLQYLYLYNNRLSGSIPSAIGSLINLSAFLMGTNQLTGAIPSTIGKLVNLQQLDLSNNKIGNFIPFSIGNLVNAQYINVSANELVGPIPSSLGNLTGVQILELANNKLSGSIPSSIGKLSHLQFLYLQDNNLSGAIPSAIGSLQNLGFLYLNSNKLSGTITSDIGNLTNLQLLVLSDNQLSGTIPASVGKLTNLDYLYLDNNNLSGAIPASIMTLTNLQYLYLDHNHLTQKANKNPALPLNVWLHADISYNDFTFDGLEFVAMHYPFVTYSPQESLFIHTDGDGLSLYAGGTLGNNSYTWFKVEDMSSTAMQGDSVFHPATTGRYYAHVRNAIATQLVLYTDTFTYTVPFVTNKTAASLPAVQNTTAFVVYPNPARDIAHVRLSGNAIITLTDADGKLMLSKNINGSDMIDVSRFASGTYYLQNKTTGEVLRIIVIH